MSFNTAPVPTIKLRPPKVSDRIHFLTDTIFFLLIGLGLAYPKDNTCHIGSETIAVKCTLFYARLLGQGIG